MGIYGKIIVIFMALPLLVLYSSMSVCAQPLGFGSPQPQQKSQQQILSSANGRFVFGQISDSSKDQFMLDTFTGRLWRITKRTDTGICLMSVPYRTAEGECSALPEEISDSGSREVKKQ